MKNKNEIALRKWTLGVALVIFVFVGAIFADNPEYEYSLAAELMSYHQAPKSLKSFEYEYMATIRIENGDVIFRKIPHASINRSILVAVYKRRFTKFKSYKIVFR